MLFQAVLPTNSTGASSSHSSPHQCYIGIDLAQLNVSVDGWNKEINGCLMLFLPHNKDLGSVIGLCSYLDRFSFPNNSSVLFGSIMFEVGI